MPASQQQHRDDSEGLASLLQPLSVRKLTIRNRIVMAPMTREKSPDRIPGADVAAYYARRARNHVGLIITEGVAIDDACAVDMPDVPALHGEAAIEGWKHVIGAVHDAGGAIMPQLWHQGVLFDPEMIPRPGARCRRPSGILGPLGKISLDEALVQRLAMPGPAMSEEDIADVVTAYARSAANARSAGFDGIAIHGGHGYLLDSFLWEGTNWRSDHWGGTRRQRTAFAVAVVRAIRAEAGEDLPIVLRFSQFKMQDYNARLADTPQDLEEILGPLADAGVDIFDGSQRYFDTPAFPGSPLNLGGWAKKLTGKMGMCVGGAGLDQGKRDHHIDSGSGTANNVAALAARLGRGEVDLAGVGRSLLNDPEWFARLLDGRPLLPFDAANLARLT